MPRVNIAFVEEIDEWVLLSDVEITQYREIYPEGKLKVFVAEIPNARVKYYKRALDCWTKAQEYLEDVAAQSIPGKVRRFK